MESSELPKDKFFITYILFYALGTVTLIPFQFFTTATDYWMYKFRDPESNESYKSENRTQLQAEFTADFSIVSHVSNAIFIILTIIFIRRFSILTKLIFSLSGALVVFLITYIFVKTDTDSWQMEFMIVTFLTGSLLTGFCGIFMVTVFEMAPKFPPTYVAVIFTGQAICGILAALVQIISLGVGNDPSTTGLVYFASALVFVLLTLAGFLLCWKKSRFFKYYFSKEIKVQELNINKDIILTIFGKLKFYLAAMFTADGATVMIQPGLTSLIVSVHKDNRSSWTDLYFGPVITFLIFYLFDYIGRETAMIVKKPSNGIILLSASCLRLAFIPLFMFCNAQPRDHLPVVFDEDYIYIIFVVIFATTNGFLMNLCVIYAAKIPTDEEKPLAVVIMMIFLIVSLAACSFVSNALVQVL